MFPTFLVGNFFMRRPVQWNYAAGAAHGSRSEQEKKRSCSIGRQTRAVELCRWCGARVAQRAGEKAFLLDRKAEPCSGIGRAASRRKSVPARFEKAGARKESSCAPRQIL